MVHTVAVCSCGTGADASRVRCCVREGPLWEWPRLRMGVHLGFRLFRPKRRAMHGDGRSDREARDRVSRREFPVQIRHAKECLLVLLIPYAIRVLAGRVPMQHVLRMAVLLFIYFDLVWWDTPYSERRWHEACTPQGKSQDAVMYIRPRCGADNIGQAVAQGLERAKACRQHVPC